MDWRLKAATTAGTLLLALLAWTATVIMEDVYNKIDTLRDAHLRHLEQHQNYSREQPSVWRVR